MKFEVVVIPVADVDRSKKFYTTLGWRLDADFAFDNGFRVVQFTPPHSACSVQFGTKITSATPGSAPRLGCGLAHSVSPCLNGGVTDLSSLPAASQMRRVWP